MKGLKEVWESFKELTELGKIDYVDGFETCGHPTRLYNVGYGTNNSRYWVAIEYDDLGEGITYYNQMALKHSTIETILSDFGAFDKLITNLLYFAYPNNQIDLD